MDEMTFAVISDYGVDTTNELNVANLVKSWSPSFIVTGGDNVYGTSASLTVDATFITVDSAAFTADQTQSPAFSNYRFNLAVTKYYGDYVTASSFYPAIGNHDVDYDGTGAWFRSKFPGLFQNNKNYYAFQKGEIGFFILSSGYKTDGTVFEPDGNTSASAQKTWLQNQLAASTARIKAVVFHHPPFSSTSGYSFPALDWDFAGMGADVVINGHAHNYQRWTDKAIPYIVAGIGGASLYNFNQSTTGSIVDNPPRFGALKCTVRGHELLIQAIAVGGTVIDSLVLCASMNEDLHDQLPSFTDPSSSDVTMPSLRVVAPFVYATATASVPVTMPTLPAVLPTVVADNSVGISLTMPSIDVVPFRASITPIDAS
jgi:predicted phosphodiesterase